MAYLLKRMAAGEEGATMVEYALMMALIGAALAGVVTSLTSSIGTRIAALSDSLGGPPTNPFP